MFTDGLAHYRIKMESLKVDETLHIPRQHFAKWPPHQREKPMSDGLKTWLMTAKENGIDVKRIR